MRANSFHGSDDVRARLAEDDHGDRLLAIRISGRAQILRRINDRRYIRESNCSPVVVAHNQRFVIISVRNLIVCQDVQSPLVVTQLTARFVRVLKTHHRADIRQRHSVTLQFVRDYLDSHRGCRSACNDHLAHAVDLRKLLRQDRRRQVINLRHLVFVGRETQDHDRSVGWIHLAVGRILRKIGRQIRSCGIDGGLYVTCSAVDVAIQVKLQ